MVDDTTLAIGLLVDAVCSNIGSQTVMRLAGSLPPDSALKMGASAQESFLQYFESVLASGVPEGAVKDHLVATIAARRSLIELMANI